MTVAGSIGVTQFRENQRQRDMFFWPARYRRKRVEEEKEG